MGLLDAPTYSKAQTDQKIEDGVAELTPPIAGEAAESKVRELLLSTPAGRSGAASEYPNFVPTGESVWTAADTTVIADGLPQNYWENVKDTQPLTGLPGRWLFGSSSDHAPIGAGEGGFAVAWGPDHLSPGLFTKIAVVGIPAALSQLETASFNIDALGGRIILTFQAIDTSNGNAQNTHIATSTDGLVWTYLTEVAKLPGTMMGGEASPHGGYMGEIMPWGNGYAAWTLAGGTSMSLTIRRATRDFTNWCAIGAQVRSGEDINWNFPVWIGARFFYWRGQLWALLPRRQVGVVGGLLGVTTSWVARVDEDLFTLLSDPVQVLPDLTDASPNCIVAVGDTLVAYYRDGGPQGDIKTAIAEG